MLPPGWTACKDELWALQELCEAELPRCQVWADEADQWRQWHWLDDLDDYDEYHGLWFVYGTADDDEEEDD